MRITDQNPETPILDRFLVWVEMASTGARIGAARALVGACDTASADSQRGQHIGLMLGVLAGDRSIDVRRSLADAAARSIDVPRGIVVGLSQDQSAVSLPILRGSSLLNEADLVDAVTIGDTEAQTAVACRADLPVAAMVALAEIGSLDAIAALCSNGFVVLPDGAAKRIMERFGACAEIREALLHRGDLDPLLRHGLVVEATRALTSFAMACDWMTTSRADRLTRECRDKAAVTIAMGNLHHDEPTGPRRLAAHLKTAGHLTPALLLRSLLSGSTMLFEAALAECSGASSDRVAGLVRAVDGLGFTAVYTKAGLPPALMPVFRSAIRAAHTAVRNSAAPGTLDHATVRQVIAACPPADDGANGQILALLHRFEAEALRDLLQRPAGQTPLQDGRASRTPIATGAWALPRLDLRQAA